jgi:hypothetical protein
MLDQHIEPAAACCRSVGFSFPGARRLHVVSSGVGASAELLARLLCIAQLEQ